MVDDQAVLAFLQHLDLVLSAALRGDEQQRLHRLTMIHALVMALLADPQELDQTLRQGATGPAALDSVAQSWAVYGFHSCPDGPLDLELARCHGLGPTRTAGHCLGDNCQSSVLYGSVGSGQVRLGGDSVESGLVRLSCGLWNDHENDPPGPPLPRGAPQA